MTLLTPCHDVPALPVFTQTHSFESSELELGPQRFSFVAPDSPQTQSRPLISALFQRNGRSDVVLIELPLKLATNRGIC